MDATRTIQIFVAQADLWLTQAAHDLGDWLPWILVGIAWVLTIVLNLCWNKRR